MTEQTEQTLIQKLCNPLDKADIELRVGTTSAKGFSLLAYKTARTDVKRLNEVCGLNWSNTYFYDAKDILSCAIAIKHDGEWVSRVDVGTESNTEKEKGSYSDAFKRAGFKWGIGIELYQSPFIWVNWEMKDKKPEGFYPSNLDIQEYLVIDGVPHFKIAYIEKGKAKIIFNNIPNAKKEESEAISPYDGEKPDGVTSRQLSVKFTEIKNELEASADLASVTAVWAEYQPDLKIIRDFDQQSFNSLEIIKNEAKKLYA
jgi:hypothetical protein